MSDLVSASAAARKAGVTAETLRYWIDQERVKLHGRGARRALLVSRSEAIRVAGRRQKAVSQAQAAKLLRVETREVARMCAAGLLPYRRYGKGQRRYEIDRAAVEALAAERTAEREPFCSVMAASPSPAGPGGFCWIWSREESSAFGLGQVKRSGWSEPSSIAWSGS